MGDIIFIFTMQYSILILKKNSCLKPQETTPSEHKIEKALKILPKKFSHEVITIEFLEDIINR